MENNPNNLSVDDIAEFTLSQPGYYDVSGPELYKLKQKLGPKVVETTVEITKSDEVV